MSNLYRCEHFTVRIIELCAHGAGHPSCLGVEKLFLVLRKHKHPGGDRGGVFDWCPYKCETLIEAGRQDEVVARSQALGSGESDMEMFDKMCFLASHGEEVKENDHNSGDGEGMSYGGFVVAFTAGTFGWDKRM
ncbi:hypothetical protein VP1G_07410 [Cytospora mali]|uniref:Uncharacterized protein n=1 Tax=Cytospora mali TaxID=578113 RepID=A0A194V882_CYTMA|nr:hypothetical protein VP1G_07410 [Valsa mali var. pyri (nom. inval.)]